MACYDAPAIPTSNVCTRRPRRSKVNGVAIGRKRKGPGKYSVSAQAPLPAHFSVCKRYWLGCGAPRPNQYLLHTRSEEHTSELQSRLHLVCRLLLEKKKKKIKNTYINNTMQNKI